MKTSINQKKIARNVKLTKYLTFGTLAILAAAAILSFRQAASPTEVSFAFGLIVIAFVLSQVSVFLQVKWGRSPRPDEQILAGLKGLDDRFSVFVYSAPVPYLVTSPTGIWCLIPFHQEGRIEYDSGRWKQHGGNFFRKLFGADRLGRPDLEASAQTEILIRNIKNNIPGVTLPEITPLLVFTDPKVILDVEGSPLGAIPLRKLKEVLRKKGRPDQVPDAVLAEIEKTYQV